MVVQVSLLRNIFHAIVGTGTSGPMAMGSLHIMRVVSIVPGSDNHIGLPICCLHRVLVLHAVVLDSGSKVWVLLSQHSSEHVVVVSILEGILKLVPSGPPHLFLGLWSC
jgi:hypothetical protein